MSFYQQTLRFQEVPFECPLFPFFPFSNSAYTIAVVTGMLRSGPVTEIIGASSSYGRPTFAAVSASLHLSSRSAEGFGIKLGIREC
jgi:hypothetical protein